LWVSLSANPIKQSCPPKQTSFHVKTDNQPVRFKNVFERSKSTNAQTQAKNIPANHQLGQ
jgi:hypothetical protein